jgi:alanine racemase
VVPFAQLLVGLPSLRLEGLWTHFAAAEERDKAYTYRQLSIYRDTLHRLEEAGFPIPLRHAANSGATIDLPESHFDMVRCGIAIYGLYPSAEVSRPISLRPALSLKARLGRVRILPAGSSISYGRTHITTKPTRIVLLPIGYGDGVSRGLSNRGSVLIRGHRLPIVGHVCMDSLMVDAGDLPVEQDDEAVLIGRQGDEEISAEEVAYLLGTINYEVVTAIAERVPRVYRRGGEVVETLTLPGNRDRDDASAPTSAHRPSIGADASDGF